MHSPNAYSLFWSRDLKSTKTAADLSLYCWDSVSNDMRRYLIIELLWSDSCDCIRIEMPFSGMIVHEEEGLIRNFRHEREISIDGIFSEHIRFYARECAEKYQWEYAIADMVKFIAEKCPGYANVSFREETADEIKEMRHEAMQSIRYYWNLFRWDSSQRSYHLYEHVDRFQPDNLPAEELIRYVEQLRFMAKEMGYAK